MQDFTLPEGIQENNPGMLSLEEGHKLAELAQGKIVLELGSYTGLSTIVMARVAKQVWSVDWHKGDEGAGRHDTLVDFMRNVEHFGVRDKIVKVVARFEDCLPFLRRSMFDMVYIDGAHDFESVYRDTCQAQRLSYHGGIIVCHDVDQDQVKRAFTQAIYSSSGFSYGPGRLGIFQRQG
jgi:predicted O-methyltransferase YrrM